MTSAQNDVKNPTPKLLPHQIAFLDTFFSPESKRAILLHGDVGVGKTTTLVALVARLLKEHPTAKVLFLGPKALQVFVIQLLRDAGLPGLPVDRYRYRQMIDTRSEGDFWPPGTVVVMSIDFARQSDIKNSVLAAQWDLVVVDEAHLMRGSRSSVTLRKFGARAERVVLATAIPFDSRMLDLLPEESPDVVWWRRDRVVGHDGSPLDVAPRPVLYEIPFTLNESEVSLRKTVKDLCEIFGGLGGMERFRVMTLIRALESSPAALEVVLQRLAEGFDVQQDIDELEASLNEEELERRLIGALDRSTTEKAADIVVRALQNIEAISVDSKLTALLAWLNQVTMERCLICLLSDYVASAFYLAAEIEGGGMVSRLLHGGMVHEDRFRSLESFSHEGGILIGTRAVMTEGINLTNISDLILYDIPGSEVALQQVLGRVDRIGRRSRLKIHCLMPSNVPDSLSSEGLVLLRKILSCDASYCSDLSR